MKPWKAKQLISENLNSDVLTYEALGRGLGLRGSETKLKARRYIAMKSLTQRLY